MTLNPANETGSPNDSDYRASKIIPNDTKLEPISRELISEIQTQNSDFGNPIFNFCVDVMGL